MRKTPLFHFHVKNYRKLPENMMFSGVNIFMAATLYRHFHCAAAKPNLFCINVDFVLLYGG